jgi:hypothetical protein
LVLALRGGRFHNEVCSGCRRFSELSKR